MVKIKLQTRYSVGAQQIIEDFQCIVSKIRHVMAIPNQAAYLSMMDAYDKIKGTKWFMGEAKRELNLAVKAYDEFERTLHYGSYNGRDFFGPAEISQEDKEQGYKQLTREDLWDFYLLIGGMSYKRYAKHVETLRWQILQCFTKARMQDRETMSYICVANTIIQYAVVVYNHLLAEYRNTYGIDISPVFASFRMDKVSYHFNKASCYLGKKVTLINGIINLNDDKNIRLAFDAFQTQMMLDLMNSASALEAAIESDNIFTEEEITKFKELYDKQT